MSMKIRVTKAPIYEGDMPLNMKIDQLEGKLKTRYPNMSWDDRLMEARKLLKGSDN